MSKDRDRSHISFCPTCGCPIQKLAAGNSGMTTGTLEDALKRHAEVVHPDQMPE